MSTSSKRNLATFLLVLGAVVFGMVLAGGLQLTVPGAAEQDTSNLSATKIASHHLSSLPSFADLAEAVDPAVVSIQAATIEKTPAGGRRGGNDPFEFFFGPRNRPRQPQQQPDGEDQDQQPDEFRSDAGGSGFVISPDGLIVTNNHVIEGATTVKVHLGDRDYTAQVKGADKATDIALLKIDAGHQLHYLELGDSDAIRVGDWVMVVGNPLNLDKTVTTGVVSAKGRAIGISRDVSFENFIQTDAAINFGNSGGPLLNLQGQVVAIATAINAGAENIGFAVPVNTLKEVLPQLKEKGKVSRGYLGISIRNLDYNQAQAFGLSNTDGALVQSVEPDTPAADAGVQHGDIILSVDGRKIKTTRDLIGYVSAKGPNASVSLDILRDGKNVTRTVKLRERPVQNEQAQERKPEGGSGIDWLGIQYQDLSGSLRQGHAIPDDLQGVIVTSVAPTSPLYEQLVRPGMIISEVNGHPVKGVADFEKAIKSAKKGSFLRLYTMQLDPRGRPQPFFAVVQVP
ncbi:MAG: Do family serine endopeptidase [Thermoanaerobaculia bacterium]